MDVMVLGCYGLGHGINGGYDDAQQMMARLFLWC